MVRSSQPRSMQCSDCGVSACTKMLGLTLLGAERYPAGGAADDGRQRLNIHGAIDLETGKTRIIEAATVNAVSTIMLLMAIETMYPGKRLIHLFVDNARYHHAKLVQAWLARPGCRIKLHFIPAYCPHLDPIERLWGLMHKHVTHNRCHATFADVKAAVLSFCARRCPENRTPIATR
jgi:DDE superfamily endonuclease